MALGLSPVTAFSLFGDLLTPRGDGAWITPSKRKFVYIERREREQMWQNVNNWWTIVKSIQINCCSLLSPLLSVWHFETGKLRGRSQQTELASLCRHIPSRRSRSGLGTLGLTHPPDNAGLLHLHTAFFSALSVWTKHCRGLMCARDWRGKRPILS